MGVKCRLRVLENTVPRRIFELNREEVAGGWRIVHNEQFHELYASPNIIRVIKSRSISWAGHIICMGETDAYNILDWISGK
jgi:hypothetical protein